MKENKIWNDYLPEDMQEHWTVYECLKESEDSSTFLVKETATGILCVLKWGRNRQAEFLRNEMEIMEKMADRKLSGIPKAYRIFEENGEVYLVREYIWLRWFCKKVAYQKRKSAGSAGRYARQQSSFRIRMSL